MESNPYRPPGSSLTDVPLPPAPRPVSAWLLIAFLSIAVLGTAFSVARLAWLVLSQEELIDSSVRIVIDLIWQFGFAAAFVATIFGIYRRRQWARWVGLAVIAITAVTGLMSPDNRIYASEAEETGATIGRILLFALMAWWAYAYAYSQKAKRYFAQPGRA